MPAILRPCVVEYVVQRHWWLCATQFIDAAIRTEADHSKGKTSERLLLSRRYVFVNNFGKTSREVRLHGGALFLFAPALSCANAWYFRPNGGGYRWRGSEIYISASVRKRMIRDTRTMPRRRRVREQIPASGGLVFFLIEHSLE